MRVARIALLALALGALPVLAQDSDDEGGGFLEGLIENALSGPGFEVDVRGFRGALSSRATMEAIVISDDDGPWLTITDAVLDWDRSALLRGRLEVEELIAAEIAVPRLPTPDPSAPTPEARPFSLPELPVSVEIGTLAVDRLVLGEPLFGAAAVVSLNGSASLVDGALDTDLTIARVDGQQGTFNIDVAYGNADQRLSIDVTVDEAADGIVANLIDLPGRPSLTASIQGEGPLDDLTVALALTTDGEPRLAGTVSTSVAADGTRAFSADLGGDIAPVFTPEYRPFFGPEIALSVNGTRQPDGVVRIDRFALTAQSLDLEGSVRLGADNAPDFIDVQGRIAAADGSRVTLPVGQGIEVDAIALDVAYDTTEGDAWTGEIVVEGLEQAGLRLGRVALDGTGQIAGQGETLAVTANLDLDAQGLEADDPGVAQALGDALTGQAVIDWSAGAPVVLERLAVSGQSLTMTGNGQVDPTGENVPLALTAQASIADLAAFSTLAGRELAGQLDADLDLTALALTGAFDVTLGGTAQDLRTSVPQLDGLLDGRTVLTLRADRDETGTRVPQLTLDNEDIMLTASADLSSEGGTATADLRLPDLSQVDPALSGPGVVTLDAVNGGTGWVIEANADGAGLVVDGDGTFTDLEADSPLFEGRLAVTAADLARFSGVAGRELGGSVDLTASGNGRLDLSDVTAQIEATTQSLAVGQAEADRLLAGTTNVSASVTKNGANIVVPSFDLRNPQITATGEATYTDAAGFVNAAIRMPELNTVVPALSGPATLTLEAQQDDLGWTIALDGNGAGVRIDGDGTVTELDAASPLATADLTIAAEGLERFSDIVGRELGGSVDLNVTGQTRFDLSQADVAVDGTATDLRVGQAEADNLLAGTTTLSGRMTKDGTDIVVPAFALRNPQIAATGQASYTDANGFVDADIRMAELGTVVPSLSGPATLTLEAQQDDAGWTIALDGNGAGVRIDGDGTVTELDAASPLARAYLNIAATGLDRFSDIAGRTLGGAVDLKVAGEARFDLSAADVSVDGTATDLALGQPELDRLFAGTTTLDGRVTKDGEIIASPGIALENAQVSLTADGRYAPGESAVQAALQFPDLNQIVPEMSGPGKVQLFAEEVGDTWQVSLDGDGAGVVLDAVAEVANIGTQRTPVVTGTVSATAADLSRFSRIVNRTLGGSLELSAEGSVAIDASTFDVAANGSAESLRVGVAQADQLLTGRTTFAFAGSRDRATAPIQVQRLTVDASGFNVDAQGTLLGGQSDMTIDARLADLGGFVTGLNGPVTARGSLGQSGSNITVDVDLTGPAGITAALDGTVAESFDSADLGVTGAVPLRLANPFIAPRSLDGTARVELRLNGPLALSSITGQVATTDGRAVLPTLSIVLDPIALTARLDGNRVVLDGTATKQAGGQLRISGPISLTQGYAADLQLALDGLVFEDPELYRTTTNGEITLVGPLTGAARIGGQIVLEETEVRIPSTGLGGSGYVPDGLEHVNIPANVDATRARAGLTEQEDEPDGASGGGGGGYALDLLIVADNRIFVRGRGLDAELGGRLRLTGTTGNVIPVGQFDLIRGRLDLLGKRLDLTEGQITLQGDFVPFVRLVATTDTGDVVVRIIVEGDVSDPTISFASTPSLPEEEVLARLLFGRGLENISPLQAAQLAQAVATLSGRGGEGIVSRLRNSVGLDDLDITTDEDGNFGLRAGKYLSETIYSDVTVNATGEAEINLNLDITDSLTARGGASSSGDTSLGIYFEKDY